MRTSPIHPTRSRVRRAVPLVAAAAVAGIAATGTGYEAAVTLAATGAVDLGQGLSVVPAPGWTVADQGSGWVRLNNEFSTAELEIKVKPASGTDPAAALQGDINQLSNVTTTGLSNVGNLSAPTTKPLQSSHFQQQAAINYTADGSSQLGAIPVSGWFMELLDGSTHRSAFVVFTENGDAPASADDEAGAIIDSML